MTSYNCEHLCTDIHKYFLRTLKTLYENINDCPSVLLEICISDYQNTIQYSINEDGTLTSSSPSVPDYFYEIPETGYHGTFDSKKSDAIYFYKHGNTAIYISFLFHCDVVPEILKTLTRVFIESTVKPLSKILDSSETTYFSYDFWREFDEETIVSKTIAEYLAYFYCLDNNFINLLSTQKYESEELNGLIFASRRGTERPVNKIRVRLSSKVPLEEELRKTRKLMEISSSNLAMLVGQNNMILGYAQAKEQMPYECRIEIIGHLNVNFSFDNNIIVKYTQGRYRIQNSRKPKCPRFPKKHLSLTTHQAKRITSVLHKASSQKHGTLFIIGNKENINSEVTRLCGCGRGIQTHHFSLYKKIIDKENSEPISRVDGDLINCISSIDGAVFMDTNCVCHGIGIILDGTAKSQGKSGRGARYNSAVTYIESQKGAGNNFIAAIISEDSPIEYFYPTDSNKTTSK